MYGLVKVAKSGKQIVDDFTRQFSSEPLLPTDEFFSLFHNLRNKHNLKSQLSPVEDVMANRYYPPNDFFPNGLIASTPHKNLLLHEAGHALDPKFVGDATRANTIIQKGLPGSAAVGMAAPSISENISKDEGLSGGTYALAGAAPVVGAGLGFGAGKIVERTEDRANKFVKDYLTDEFGGDAAKAKKVFDESPLPIGRKSYNKQTKNLALRGGAMGAVAGGAGLGAAYLTDKLKSYRKQKNELK